MSTDLGRVRDAIAQWAHADATGRPDHGKAMIAWDRAGLDEALKAHDVDLSPDDLDAALTVLRRRSFMGGNYTLDARAVVAVTS